MQILDGLCRKRDRVSEDTLRIVAIFTIRTSRHEIRQTTLTGMRTGQYRAMKK